MSLAVVFDSAGTLMKTVRAVFSIEENRIIPNAETTLLVFEDSNRMLVLLNAGQAAIFSGDSTIPLSEWIAQKQISFAVSCGRGDEAAAKEIIFKETKACLQNLQAAVSTCKEAAEKESRIFALNTGLILNTRKNAVEYLVAAAGHPFSGVKEVIQTLQDAGVIVCIASGDRQEKLEAAAELFRIPKEQVFGAATPEKKADVVRSLQERFDAVIMTGDGINDLPAFHQADYAVLTIEQPGRRPDILFDAADAVITDIREIIGIARRFL